MFDIVADGIFHPVWSDNLQASVRLFSGVFRAEGITKPICAGRDSDTIAFGCISLKLLVRRPVTISGTQHGELVSGAFYLRPVYNSLKFTDIKSLYTHKNSFLRMMFCLFII